MYSNVSYNVSVHAFKKAKSGRSHGHGFGHGQGQGCGCRQGGYHPRLQSGLCNSPSDWQGKCGKWDNVLRMVEHVTIVVRQTII